MKLATITALSAALLVSSAGLGLAQSKGGNASDKNNQSDDCGLNVNDGSDMAANQSLRCRTEAKPGTVINNENDVTGSTAPAPQRKHNMNETVPEAETP